jgi:hypothetical protein
MSLTIYYPKLIYGFNIPKNYNTNYQHQLSSYYEYMNISKNNINTTSQQTLYGIELEIDDQTGIPFISENIKNKVFQVYQNIIEHELKINSKFNISNIKLGYHLAISTI